MISLVGMAVLILAAIVLSTQRRAIQWRTVSVAWILQVLIGAFALYVPWGQQALGSLAAAVSSLQL
jgi:CNT family concentrative nucleoside transporter